jgi:hypothetical protein
VGQVAIESGNAVKPEFLLLNAGKFDDWKLSSSKSGFEIDYAATSLRENPAEYPQSARRPHNETAIHVQPAQSGRSGPGRLTRSGR